MPMILSGELAGEGGAMEKTVEPTLHPGGVPAAEATAAKIGTAQQIGRVTATQPAMGWGLISLHVLIITIISNIGKMFPMLCYRKEAHRRERLALAIGMWPRGEVGAGVLVISLSYGIGGPVVTVAMLSLALNLMLTGLFIFAVKQLTATLPAYRSPDPADAGF
jgi:Kef-type K+ transport system membrane component KefB